AFCRASRWALTVRRVSSDPHQLSIPVDKTADDVPKTLDCDSFLVCRISVADGYCFIVQAIEVDCDTERGADLVLAAVAAAYVAAGLVVLHPELASQALDHFLGDFDQLRLLR